MLANACGPCIGQWNRLVQRCLTSCVLFHVVQNSINSDLARSVSAAIDRVAQQLHVQASVWHCRSLFFSLFLRNETYLFWLHGELFTQQGGKQT